MVFEDIFEKLGNPARERCKLKPVSGVWQQLSKDLYQNKVMGKKLTRIAFERLQDQSPAGSFIVEILRS